MKEHTFSCDICGETKTYKSDFSTGYGKNAEGQIACYACCALEDKQWMEEHDKITLYLDGHTGTTNGFAVTNWPGSLRMPCSKVRIGGHNWGLVRHDVWFTDHTGQNWWGVHVGHMTDLVHCRKVK